MKGGKRIMNNKKNLSGFSENPEEVLHDIRECLYRIERTMSRIEKWHERHHDTLTSIESEIHERR